MAQVPEKANNLGDELADDIFDHFIAENPEPEGDFLPLDLSDEELEEVFEELDRRSPTAGELTPASRLEFATFMALVCAAVRLGRGALAAFEPVAGKWLRWAEEHHDPAKGPFAGFARSVLQTAWRRYYGEIKRRPRALANELRDQHLRDSAVKDRGKGWLALETYWRRRLRLEFDRRYRKWKVPGRRRDELIDDLMLILFEEVTAGGEKLRRYEVRAGREATFLFLGKAKDKLRVGRSIYEVPKKPKKPAIVEVQTPEELLIEREHQRLVKAGIAKQRAKLGKPAETWLGHAGAFVDENDDCTDIVAHGIPAEIARRAGRDPSAARKALMQIKSRFIESEELRALATGEDILPSLKKID